MTDLLRPGADAGFNLTEDALPVKHERAKLEKISAEIARINARDSARYEAANVIGRLVRRVERWCCGDGRPSGVDFVLFQTPPPPLKKGETIVQCIERHRFRLRELTADQRRVESAPYPASAAKAVVRAQVNALADAAAPYTAGTIENLTPVSFVTRTISALVRNYTGPEPAVVFVDGVDPAGLVAWLLRPQLIAALENAIEDDADDANAISEQDRAERLAQIVADKLLVERNEVSLIEQAASEGIVIAYREDTDPRAALALDLVVAQPVASDLQRQSWLR